MRKDEPNAVNSSFDSHPHPTATTATATATATATTAATTVEFSSRLQWERLLAECSIENKVGLQLVGHMHSTEHPHAWQVIDEMVSIIRRLCRGEADPAAADHIKSRMSEYLSTTPKEEEQLAAGHLQIFMLSSAPAALVMLYMSMEEGNRDCADSAIRHFLNISRNSLPKCHHNYCAPIVLEFWVVEPLCRDLGLSMETPGIVGPLSSDVCDFTAFVLPLRTMIMVLVSFEGLIPTFVEGEGYKHPVLAQELEFLYLIFIDLLNRMDECLRRMDGNLIVKQKGEGEVVYSGWSQLSKTALCALIIKYAKRADDHQWLLERKDVTDFESRRHLAMMMFPEAKEDYEELHEMLIDRSQLLVESFEYIQRAEFESLHAGLFMEFRNEEATGPGVLQEWFFLVCQAIFNPENALFVACPNDRRRFYPKPIEEGATFYSLRIFERYKDSLRSVFMGKESALRLLSYAEDLMSNTRPENFARTFKDDSKVFILQLGFNAHGSFLMISELLYGRQKGLIIVSEGKLGCGWRGFGFHLRKAIAPDTLGVKPPSQSALFPTVQTFRNQKSFLSATVDGHRKTNGGSRSGKLAMPKIQNSKFNQIISIYQV
uniref:HECT-type E3 ubiquitin transferase n=1 Tax=Quercus lobata TaxID=97700 RepID=A0A7N2R5F7_QUELO